MIYKSLSQLKKEMTGKLVVRSSSTWNSTEIGIIKIGSPNYKFLPSDGSYPVYGSLDEKLFESENKGSTPKIINDSGKEVIDYEYCRAEFINKGFTLFFCGYSVSYVLKV